MFRLNPLAAGLNLSASLKADASSKEIEEAMRRVRETQSLISAAIEPGGANSHLCPLLWPLETLCSANNNFFFPLNGVQVKTVRDARGPGPGPNPGGGGPAHVQNTGDSSNLEPQQFKSGTPTVS